MGGARPGQDDSDDDSRGAAIDHAAADHDHRAGADDDDATTPAVVDGPPIGEVVDAGDAKPERFYDAYLAAGLADIQAWWASEYPRLYGEPFTPLAGGIFAVYPQRTAPIPGCSFPGNTTYQEVSDYGAFYCPDGDYMVYDDGELGVIYDLAERFSPSVVAVVMAHEFGHAVQARTGHLDSDLATIFTEQQADCFSGAWAQRVHGPRRRPDVRRR